MEVGSNTSIEIAIVDEKCNAHFWAPPKRARSSFKLKSTSTNCAPASNCIIMPEVTIGVIPSSIKVPRLDAMMARNQ